MPEDHKNTSSDSPSSEAGGPVPNAWEQFGSVPHRSESFRTLRSQAERTPAHTLTVKEVARLFEAAGVSRTERSIVKWCLPNKHDVARLDAFFDPNERKWFITQESAELAIAEEKARAARRNDPVPNGSEQGGAIPNGSERRGRQSEQDAGAPERIKELETQVLDLRILNGGKDIVIDQLRKERQGLMDQAVNFSRRIGQLETELRQLSGPKNNSESFLHETGATQPWRDTGEHDLPI